MADFTRQLIPGIATSSPNFTLTNFVISTTTSAVEFIFNAPEAATITRLGFRYGARALTPPTYKISLQGVDASGNPDGTIKSSGNAVATFLPPADTTWNGTWRWLNLTSSYTCTRGEFLAIVIAYSSGTVDASNNSSFTSSASFRSTVAGFPYAIHNSSGTRTRQGLHAPSYGFGSAGTAYGWPVQAVYLPSINSSTTPDEIALAFQLSGSYGQTFQVVGARGAFRSPAASSYALKLYSGTTVLQTVTVDGDAQVTAGGSTISEVYFSDTTLATLNFGSLYRLGFQPVDAAGSFFLFGSTQAAAADLAAWPGGTQMYLSTRTDAGAWTDDTTTRPFVELILSDWTPPVAGGLKINPGMSGGMSG